MRGGYIFLTRNFGIPTTEATAKSGLRTDERLRNEFRLAGRRQGWWYGALSVLGSESSSCSLPLPSLMVRQRRSVLMVSNMFVDAWCLFRSTSKQAVNECFSKMEPERTKQAQDTWLKKEFRLSMTGQQGHPTSVR